MQNLPAQFEEHAIRRFYDEATETWWFSVVDIVQVLTEQQDSTTARKYWNKLKERLKKEGSQLVTNCHQLKLPASDGKRYLTDVAFRGKFASRRAGPPAYGKCLSISSTSSDSDFVHLARRLAHPRPGCKTSHGDLCWL